MCSQSLDRSIHRWLIVISTNELLQSWMVAGPAHEMAPRMNHSKRYLFFSVLHPRMACEDLWIRLYLTRHRQTDNECTSLSCLSYPLSSSAALLRTQHTWHKSSPSTVRVFIILTAMARKTRKRWNYWLENNHEPGPPLSIYGLKEQCIFRFCA